MVHPFSGFGYPFGMGLGALEWVFLGVWVFLAVTHCKTKGPFGFTIFLCKTKIVRTKEVNTSLRCGFCGNVKLDKVCNFVKLDLSEEYVLIVVKITIFPKV